MNFKKILRTLCCFCCCVAFALVVTACNTVDHPQGILPDDNQSGNITDNNDVSTTPPDTTEHNFELVSQSGGVYTYRCADCGKTSSVSIAYVSGTKNAYKLENGTIAFSDLSEETVYSVSGEFYGNIVIDAGEDYKFELETNGLTLSSSSDCPITILSGDKVTLSAKKGTENYIYDLREAADVEDETEISSAVYAQCDLDIQGKGSLSVISANNNGIHTKDDLKIKNLDLQIECRDNALKGNDSVTIESGSIVLIAKIGDGIKTKNSDISSKGNQRGTVKISGGDILVYAACDGIDAAYDLQIDETASTVFLQIFTDKYSKYSEEVTAETASESNGEAPVYGRANDPVRPGGGPWQGGPGGFPGGGINDGNTDKGDHSAKGMKAANAVNVHAGNITIQSYDDCIHANNDTALENGEMPLGDVNISGGTVTLQTNDDGIHADNSLNVSGGTVNILSSYEGLEGQTVNISGGNVSVVSSDDGVNGTATSGTAITISGGILYVYANGDGVDSNSTSNYSGIVFSGGKAIIISTSNGNSSIDTERGYRYESGYVVAIGASGGMSNEATNTQTTQKTTISLNLQKDAYLIVGDIVTVRMPVSMNSSVVVLGKANASVSSAASSSATFDINGVSWNVTD